MRFQISRDVLLKPLQLVAGVVEKRQTMPVLANVLVELNGNSLTLTGTDLEVELKAQLEVEQTQEGGAITLPARKLLDICRGLPDQSLIDVTCQDQRAVIKAGRSRFTLSTLPAAEFPSIELGNDVFDMQLLQRDIRRLIERTAFAMAQQDVRYFLNGMLWELKGSTLRTVATDGHRLALCEKNFEARLVGDSLQVILPRKGVLELQRLLTVPDNQVQLTFGSHHFRAATEGMVFTTKLIDAKYPDYERVLPKAGEKIMFGPREELKQAFLRAAILSNEKYRGVRFNLEPGLLKLTANNPEQEEAEEQVSVEYSGEPMELGFNVTYLQDVTNVIESEVMRFSFGDSNSSILIEESQNGDALYVVMPMRL